MKAARAGYERESREARRLLSRARATVYCLDVTRPESTVLETGPNGLADGAGGEFTRRVYLVWDLTS